MEIDTQPVENDITELLSILSSMCNRNYLRLLAVYVGKINHLFVMEVEDKFEVEGKRIEHKLISSEYFDSETDIIERIESTFDKPATV